MVSQDMLTVVCNNDSSWDGNNAVGQFLLVALVFAII